MMLLIAIDHYIDKRVRPWIGGFVYLVHCQVVHFGSTVIVSVAVIVGYILCSVFLLLL